MLEGTGPKSVIPQTKNRSM